MRVSSRRDGKPAVMRISSGREGVLESWPPDSLFVPGARRVGGVTPQNLTNI